jgi:hypothetical protein
LGVDLPISQRLESVGSKTDANLLDCILSHAAVLVNLLALEHSSVHSEVLVGYDNFCIPLVNFSLANCFLFFNHIIAACKHSLKKCTLRKSAHTFYLLDKVLFAVVFGSVGLTLNLVFSLRLLPVVRDVGQLVYLGLRGLFRMQIVVFLLV